MRFDQSWTDRPRQQATKGGRLKRLGISPKTAQVHRGNLAAKLRLPSTAAIVQYATKLKILKLD